MKTLYVSVLALVGCFGFAAGMSAHAEGGSQSLIGGQALQGASGALGLNIAAGNGNVQANLGSLAVGSLAGSEARLSQSAVSSSAGGQLGATITGQVFAGASGLLQANQASGSSNEEANSAAIGLGSVHALTAGGLGQQLAAVPNGAGKSGNADGGSRTASISAQAFDRAHGVLQVSQAAGNDNRLANGFSLQVEGAVP
ncbi:hypothetical protein [Acidihalobacter prosperus]|uniref:Adhesin n=1 Tax=Acidihalobacter prosperus TaxID=160660 RepID=A0A1A6C0N1_9GAMM|nr:hypothetical protein [Acidihalobacter prosperus]OBS08115.1 hypothetical protein Thpro_022365 [Acidihalobacter prosperus]